MNYGMLKSSAELIQQMVITKLKCTPIIIKRPNLKPDLALLSI